MGVNKAIKNVNTEIAEAVTGLNTAGQEKIDNLMIELDGTPNKSRLGGNAIVATSIAVAKAARPLQRRQFFEQFGGGKEIPASSALLMFGGPAYVGVLGTGDFRNTLSMPSAPKATWKGLSASSISTGSLLKLS
jgi:enolase